MTQDDLQAKLQELMALPSETEWVEFKEARTSFRSDELGQYFSALSNEANLKGQKSGWVIFGVTDKVPRIIVGSSYRRQPPGLENLKHEIMQNTNNHLSFEGIYEPPTPDGRVVMFQIPPAPRGLPTSWKGHFYGRAGESLGPLSLHEIEQIRSQVAHEDWSAQICREATLEDLDPEAIAFARGQYKEKNQSKADLISDMDAWDDRTFLNKAKVCIGGKITRTALLLLGKNESEHFLSPGIARITWLLKGENGADRDYQHFGPPLLLAVGKVFDRVRNLTYRYMPDATLFPTEVTQYDPWVVRESLHNAIAHQDYTQGGRINVVEETESLLFTNAGDFLPGSVEEVILRDAPPEVYRNPFLSHAMVELKMIDTAGGGIKRMFTKQRERFFPMPEYDLTEPGRVKVRILGRILDERYTRMLSSRMDLDLMDVIALDKVQKSKRLTEVEFKSLKARRLIEGRRPSLFVSAEVAAATETMADYLKRRGIDKDYCKRMVVELLESQAEAKREDIDRLLMSKVSDALTDKQKKLFILNLLQEMRREGLIVAVGTTRWAKWVMCKPTAEDSV